MKLKNNFIFLICALCIFFPIGVILLILSEKKLWQKILMGIIGAAVFAALLIPAATQRKTPTDLSDLDLITTKQDLSIGQSGGFALANDTTYYTDFKASSSNDCLAVNNNTYTAIKTGTSILTVSFENQIRSVSITITDNAKTDEPVYASPTGDRYHSNLKHAGKTAVEMTEEDALRSGKTPCKICWK